MAITKDCILIDDDQDDQEIFLMALQKAGTQINCFIAKDGVEGVKMLSDTSCSPGYVFIDINMPKMNGIECLRQIKKFDHLENSRIIMYSTSANERIIGQCKELGADEFLAKPTAFAPLVAALRNIFKR
jgi:DNA-binding response OmpR family regulator